MTYITGYLLPASAFYLILVAIVVKTITLRRAMLAYVGTLILSAGVYWSLETEYLLLGSLSAMVATPTIFLSLAYPYMRDE